MQNSVTGFAMTIELKTGILDITVVAPDSYMDQTMGLAGVMNGNSTDDLLTPSGTTLPITSSEQTIYYDFGEKCKHKNSSFVAQFLYLEQMLELKSTVPIKWEIKQA